MLDLDEAWERARGLIERAGQDGRSDEQGGTIFGWYPTKPGQAALVGSRIAWLRHTVYEPLDEAELGAREHTIERPLPNTLRRFYSGCANGVELLGNDVTLYGFRRGLLLDPFDLEVETIQRPADALARHAFFGSWGDANNLLYLDADDDRIHLAGVKSVSPLRTWESLGEFLVTTLEAYLSCWDAAGRRVGTVPVPEEVAEAVPAPLRELAVPSDLVERAHIVRAALAEAPGRLRAGDGLFELLSPDQLGEMQVGFGVGPDGQDLSGEKPGDWRASWLVIGLEEDLGDPLIVDLADPNAPVYTAVHGAGSWDPQPVAPSLRKLLMSA